MIHELMQGTRNHRVGRIVQGSFVMNEFFCRDLRNLFLGASKVRSQHGDCLIRAFVGQCFSSSFDDLFPILGIERRPVLNGPNLAAHLLGDLSPG